MPKVKPVYPKAPAANKKGNEFKSNSPDLHNAVSELSLAGFIMNDVSAEGQTADLVRYRWIVISQARFLANQTLCGTSDAADFSFFFRRYCMMQTQRLSNVTVVQ